MPEAEKIPKYLNGPDAAISLILCSFYGQFLRPVAPGIHMFEIWQ